MGSLVDEIFHNYYANFLIKILPLKKAKFSQKNT